MDEPKGTDITSEDYRVYTYGNGQRFRIDNPVSLFVLPNNSHRIVDVDGVTHRPTPGYVGISWKPKDGQPAFVA